MVGDRRPGRPLPFGRPHAQHQRGGFRISAILTLPQYAEFLRRRATRVRAIPTRSAPVVQSLRDAWETVAAYGIAAPQIGESVRIFVYRPYEDEQAPPIAILNPKIVRAEGELKDYDGCLSIPGIYGPTRRAARIEVLGYDERGERHRWRFEGFTARIIQHEIDHLEGVLFIDRIDDLDELYTLVPAPDTAGDAAWQKAPLTPAQRHLVEEERRPLPPFALTW